MYPTMRGSFILPTDPTPNDRGVRCCTYMVRGKAAVEVGAVKHGAVLWFGILEFFRFLGDTHLIIHIKQQRPIDVEQQDADICPT
jgi:hypothetical protein